MPMPSLDLFGVAVANPMTCLTNLFLSVECVVFAGYLSSPRGSPASTPASPIRGERNPWTGFFFLLGLGTSLGVAKHGIAYLLPEVLRGAVIVSSGLAGMAAILVAELAVLGASGWKEDVTLALRRIALAKFFFFGCLQLVIWSFLVVTANSAIAILFLLPASHRASRTGRLGFGWISLGWGVLILASVPYLLEAAPGPWFDNVDLAHVLMMAGLALVFSGARVPPRPRDNGLTEAGPSVSSPRMEAEPWAS